MRSSRMPLQGDGSTSHSLNQVCSCEVITMMLTVDKLAKVYSYMYYMIKSMNEAYIS